MKERLELAALYFVCVCIAFVAVSVMLRIDAVARAQYTLRTRRWDRQLDHLEHAGKSRFFGPIIGTVSWH